MFPFLKSARASDNAMAVVTGAGSGIGQAFAIELAARGGEVICADIDANSARETAKIIASRGGKAFSAKCDVRDIAQVQALAAIAEKKLSGSVNLVVNNAGIGVGGTQIGAVSLEDWRATLDVNLWGVIHGCHVFSPILQENGAGGIINVASTASFSAAPYMGPYNASKAAVLAISETLFAEFAGTALRVTALCPTAVKTKIIEDGRIPGSANSFAKKALQYTGRAPASVVNDCLAAYDSGELYAIPQVEAKLIWRAKRLFPSGYARAAGSITQIRKRFDASHPGASSVESDLSLVRKQA